MTDTATKDAPWAAGLRGARANLVPGLVLQALAITLVAAYYQAPAVASALGHLTTWRADWGIWFPVVTTGLSGGVIPVLFLWSQRSTRQLYSASQALGLTAFWAYKGAEIDFWYRLQERYVGAGHDVGTVALKMFLDQFVWCPIWAIPSTVILYSGITHDFDFRPAWRDLRTPGWYGRSVLPVLISNLGVWVPAVCIIYSLPTPLQLPLQNVILIFFTLIVAHITRRR